MKPGTYTQTCEFPNEDEDTTTLIRHGLVYKGELAVGSIPSVTVGQGSTITADISDTYDGVVCLAWEPLGVCVSSD